MSVDGRTESVHVTTSPSTTTTAPRGRALALIRTVAGREISQQLRNKNFWSSLLATALLAALSLGLTTLLDRDTEQPTVAVPAGQGVLTEALRAQLPVTELPDAEAARSAVREQKADVAIIGDEIVVLRKLPDELGRTLADTFRTVTYQERLRALNAAPADVALPAMRVTTLDADAARVQQRTITAGVSVIALVLLMFMAGIGIAQGVAEEKSSRIVELLLAKVTPRQLLIGKILGLGVAALVQISVTLGLGLAAATVAGVFTAPAEILGTAVNVLLWFIPGYLLFVTLYAVAGSLASRQEDVNHVTGPVSMIQMGTLIGPILAITAPASPALGVVSMIPGLSWAAMPVRMAYSSVPFWQVAVALALTVAAVGVLLAIGSRVYTGGLLQYGGVIKVRQALRAARH
jgi:ABC-2 type transport system permease protein